MHNSKLDITELGKGKLIMKLSYVIPCYRSEKTIRMVIDEIKETMKRDPSFDYEIVAVNDCSPDGVLDVLIELAKDNPSIKVIDFMQNFGKDSAVLAGLSIVDGEIAIILDDDYQCPTYEVYNLIKPIIDGDADVTTAKYNDKKESKFKCFGSELYRVCAQSMLGMPKGIRTENFYAISRPVYKKILDYKNPYPFLDGLILRITKRVSSVAMEERNRGDDNATGFNFTKSVKMLVDGLTAFSVKPLRIATVIGFFTALSGVIYLIITILRFFVVPGGITEGYSSLLTVLLFIGGILMMMIGILGEYVGRIYICINQSPQYVIRNQYNIKEVL